MTKRVSRKSHVIVNATVFLSMMVAMTAVSTQAFMFPSSKTTMRYDASSKADAQTSGTTATQNNKVKDQLPSSALQMSDFSRDQDEGKKGRRKIKREKFELPPAPEDQFTMTGDLIGLFLYGCMDHLVSDVYLTSVLDSSPSAEAAARTLDPSGNLITAGSLPVWIDTTWTSVSEQVLRSGLQHQVMPAYAPVLSTAGLASVSLAFCWLLAGYCFQAFSFRNTIGCSTHRAVQVTGKTWMLSSLFMLTLVGLSRYYLEGNLAEIALGVDQTTTVISQVVPMNPVAQSSNLFQMQFGMLTVSDTDYIFNSLAILLTWRVMINLLIGYGSED